MSKEKITIPEIIDLMVKDKTITKKKADEFIRILISTIEDALLSGDSVKVKGLGTFKPQWNEARRSVDVNTGNEIIIPGFYRVVFAPENDLKESINEPFAHLESVTLPKDEEARNETGDSEEQPVKKSDVNLSFLSTQATEIKEILSDIGAFSVKNTEPVTDDDDTYEEEEDVYEATTRVIPEAEQEIAMESYSDEIGAGVQSQDNDDFDIIRDVSKLYYGESTETDDKSVPGKLSADYEEIALEAEIISEVEKEDTDNAYLSSSSGSEEAAVIEASTDNVVVEEGYSELVGDLDDKTGRKMEHPESSNEVTSGESDLQPEEKNSKRTILRTSMLIGTLVVIGVGVLLFSPSISRSIKEKKNQEKIDYIADSLENIKKVQFIADSVRYNLRGDTLVLSETLAQSGDPLNPEENPHGATSTVNDIYSNPRLYTEVLATERMVAGSQLTKFARQYYGHSNFWVYIYEANKDKISDPDNVPAGIDVKIPKMDSVLVNPRNKESINYALKLQSEYLK